MHSITFEIQVLEGRPELPLPCYATEGSAGMDLVASEEVVLPSMDRLVVRTHIGIALPEGYEAQIRPRSGMAAKHGVTVLNAPGTIDSDYRGELKVILYNTSCNDFQIEVGDRIAQMVLVPVTTGYMRVVKALPKTNRGSGGFGSTGK